MKMNKTALSMLAILMALSLVLSACSGGKKEADASMNSSGSSTPTEAAGAKNFDKKMTITMYNAGGFALASQPPTNKEDDPLRLMLEKAVNIDLQMTIPAADQIKPKLNTLLAAGDIPDMIFMPDRLSALQYYDQGLVADLDTTIKDYPALLNRFSQDSWGSMKYKGKTIGVPGYELVNGIKGWWIRNDWLKKLNLNAPTTPEELLNVMKAFTFNDPDGNGKNDTYGFTAGIGKDGSFNTPGVSGLGWDAIMMIFGVVPNMVDLIDGKVSFDSTDPRMKEAVTFINQMIAAKVVDPDWTVTNDGAALDKKMYSGKIGMLFNDWRRMELGPQTLMKESSGEVPDWIVIPPVKGPHGDQLVGFAQFQNNSWAISKNAAKDPEKMKRILSLLQYWYADKEAYPYFAYGPKGIFWDMVDGKPTLLQENKKDANLVAKWQWIANYFLPRYANDALYFNFNNPKTNEYHNLNMKYVKPNLANPFVVVDANDTLYGDRIKYVNESLLKIILGKDSLSDWDTFLKTLDTKFEYQKYKDYVTKQLKDAGVQ